MDGGKGMKRRIQEIKEMLQRIEMQERIEYELTCKSKKGKKCLEGKNRKEGSRDETIIRRTHFEKPTQLFLKSFLRGSHDRNVINISITQVRQPHVRFPVETVDTVNCNKHLELSGVCMFLQFLDKDCNAV